MTNDSSDRIYRRSRYRVRRGGVQQVIDALKKYTDYMSMNEPGTQSYLVVQAGSDPSEFVHISQFADQRAFEISQGSAAYKAFVNALQPVLEGEVIAETVAGSVVCGAGAGYVAPTDLVILVKFRVKDRSRIKRFREIINEDLANFRLRGDPKGLLEFEAFSDSDDDRVYYYSQRWVSAEAQRLATQTYVNFAETNRLCRPLLLALHGGR